MSIQIAILIMLLTGIFGGFINFLLPSNEKDGKNIRSLFKCVILGIGAALLVPLFLEIAQSQILEGLHWPQKKQVEQKIIIKNSKDETDTLKIDSTFKVDDSTLKNRIYNKPRDENEKTSIEQSYNKESDIPKIYLLFAAYCLVAAAAGFRFIDVVIMNVIKEKEYENIKTENQDLKKETEKRQANSQISQKKEDKEIRKQLLEEKSIEIATIAAKDPTAITNIELPLLPILPPVTNPDDPQKGRFGGKSENNYRRLEAEVESSEIKDFYHVKFWVESTDPKNHPLNTEVIFYIHDSFSPSVFTYKPSEFTSEGKALEEEILSYGAFTIGVITDNGKTMLELDLAEQNKFPKKFRSR